MGTVYRARQHDPVQRQVALKIIKLGMDTTEVIRRFESERQALAVMEHPNIARVFDGGATETGRPYFVMELVDGVTITKYCDTHLLTTEQRVRLFVDVCDAVQHAHQKGVIHRDLKPSNLLVAEMDGRPVCKVIDFGIARVLDQEAEGRTRYTQDGHVVGTPQYMSPEQITGDVDDVDTRTDIYALGVILYELLCGTLPRDQRAYHGPALFGVVATDPPTPSKRFDSLSDTQETVARLRRSSPQGLRRALRGDLDWIVAKAMDRDRARRYGAAVELASDLRRYLSGDVVLAGPPSTAYRLKKFVLRHRGAVAAGLALAVTLVAGATLSTVGFVRADRNAVRAQDAAARAIAANDFLDRMLRAADPVGGGTESTTVKEVLDAASEDVAAGTLGDEPLVEASVRRSIGGTYMQLGLYQEAEEHLTAAYELLTATAGADPQERVHALADLAQLWRRQGDPARSVDFYRDALSLADSLELGSEGNADERLLDDLRNDLAVALQDAGRFEEAAEMLGPLVESDRRLLAHDDVNLAASLNNLALVLRDLGRYEEAMSLFRESLDVLRAAFGESHIYVAGVLESMGSMEQSAGRMNAADSLLTEAMAMRRALLGERHPDVINGLNGLGLLHVEMEEYDAARTELDEALALSVEVLGASHRTTGTTLNSIGLLELGLGDAAAAEAALRRSFEIRRDALGELHPTTLNTGANLARALLAGGRTSEAEALARRVVDGQVSAGVQEPLRRGLAMRVLGQSLTALGRFDEAEPELLEAHDIVEAAVGPEHPQTRAAVDAIVTLYDAWGQPDQAEEWRGR